MLKHSIGAHRHVVVSHVELLHLIELSSVKTHLSHVLLRDVHLIRFFPLRELLVHGLVLSEGGACEVSLVHLHLVRAGSHHVNEHG